MRRCRALGPPGPQRGLPTRTGIALLNSLANGGIRVSELVIADIVIVVTVSVLEAAPFSGREESRSVNYDRLDLLSPDAAPKLLTDLRQRTHLPIERCEIGDLDLLRDSVRITVFYRQQATPRTRRSASTLLRELSSGMR
jgi:hypothetical protein